MKLYNKSAKLFKQLTFVYWEGLIMFFMIRYDATSEKKTVP